MVTHTLETVIDTYLIANSYQLLHLIYSLTKVRKSQETNSWKVKTGEQLYLWFQIRHQIKALFDTLFRRWLCLKAMSPWRQLHGSGEQLPVLLRWWLRWLAVWDPADSVWHGLMQPGHVRGGPRGQYLPLCLPRGNLLWWGLCGYTDGSHFLPCKGLVCKVLTTVKLQGVLFCKFWSSWGNLMWLNFVFDVCVCTFCFIYICVKTTFIDFKELCGLMTCMQNN